MTNREDLPLHDIRVIAFEQAVAAPLCTRHLADLGADVIKVERVGEGDFARTYDSALNGTSTYFAWLNRNKRSIAIDLQRDEGKQVARRLIAGADVVVQNFSAGAFARLGLGAASLRAEHPALVYASISGYGENGPYANRKAYDMLVQAEAGVLSITGTPEQPSKSGIALVDFSSGLYAFGAIMTALYRRRATGEGATIDVSLFDSVVEWMTPYSLLAAYAKPPGRAGARHSSIVPYGSYRTGDGRSVMLAVQNEREWQRLCRDVLDRPALAVDPRFTPNENRLANRRELEALIEEALAALTVEETERRLEAAALAFSRMNEAADVLTHPQAIARDRFLDVTLEDGSSVALPRTPFNIEGIEEAPARIAALGEHTDAVLASLGYDAGAIASLREARVVG